MYYKYENREQVQATKVNQLLSERPELNYEAIPAFLAFQYSIGEDTLFKGIRALPPAGISPAELVPPNEYGYLRQLIREAVAARVSPAQRASLFLSGGLDSSTLAAAALSMDGNKVEYAITATFDGHSEEDKAERVVRHVGIRHHHKVHITAGMVARHIRDITAAYEEPIGDAGLINNYFLCKFASTVSDVALCGDGGDEIFGGYPWHRFARYIPMMNRTPRWLRGFARGLVSGDITSRRNVLERVLLLPAQPSIDDMILYSTTAASRQNVEWLLAPAYRSRYDFYDFYHSDRNNLYDRALAIDCLNMVPGKYGRKLDKFYPPTLCAPLADRRILSFAFSLPAKQRQNKYILRRAFEDMLPAETVWGHKAAFGTPIAQWLTSDALRPMVVYTLEKGKLLNEICKKDSLSKMIGVLKSGRLGGRLPAAFIPANLLWGMFALQIWYDVWFEK